MRASALRQARMENTDHPSLAAEAKRTGITPFSEGPRMLVVVVVVDGELLGLDAELIASVGLRAGVTSHPWCYRLSRCRCRSVAVKRIGVIQKSSREMKLLTLSWRLGWKVNSVLMLLRGQNFSMSWLGVNLVRR